VFVASLPALAEIGLLRFITDDGWHPTGAPEFASYNVAPMIAATVLVSLGALLWTAPTALAIAMFCTVYAPPQLAVAVRRAVEIAAGIPSVVFGFWGLVCIVPWIAWVKQPGQSLIAGVIILGLMILPTIVLFAIAAIRATPVEHLQGAVALGLSRLTTLRRIILPSAWRGITTGILLGGSRALGETMAVLMVCGLAMNWPTNPFDSVRPLTANIALEMVEAGDLHRSALFLSGLFLLLLVTLMVAFAELLTGGPVD